MYTRGAFAATTAVPAGPSLLSAAFAGGLSGPASGAPLYASSASSAPSSSASARWNMAPLSASISDPIPFGGDVRQPPALVIRRLPQNISGEALGSMLIFAGDLLDTEIIRSPYKEDRGFTTAVARFQTHAGALEAQQKLHGKPNATKEANMIVEIHSGSMAGPFARTPAADGLIPRTQASSTSSAGSSAGPPPTASRSRFNSTFQSAEKTSPLLPTPSSSSGSATSTGSAELPVPESSSHLSTLFSPQSPVANGVDARRISGKSMINDDDAGDDETGELLKDPVGYARSGQHPHANRRQTNPPSLPIGRFGSLSLNADGNADALRSPTASNGLTSPRAAHSLHSPTSPPPPCSTAGTFYSPLAFPRPQYPPINPADQNPPCNTLYVGNLPIDTSEDELKAIFSKQRGYRRLCFRTKQNGPMCFVEFEDISFATKALNELYGHPLHNSVKGGIRLSFSKNPLGVRSGQVPNGSTGPAHSVMSPHALTPGYNGVGVGIGVGVNGVGGLNGHGASFSAVSGPPPGLTTPPGLMNGAGPYRTGGMDATFGPHASFGFPMQDFPGQMRSPPTLSGGVPPSINGSFGRDVRYSEFTPGR